MRLGVPGRRDLRGGRGQHARGAVLAWGAVRPRLPDQLSALHLVRALHRGLPDDSRESLIWTKEQLVAPLQSGMEAPPHPMRLGETEEDYYRLGAMLARSEAQSETGSPQAGEAQ